MCSIYNAMEIRLLPTTIFHLRCRKERRKQIPQNCKVWRQKGKNIPWKVYTPFKTEAGGREKNSLTIWDEGQVFPKSDIKTRNRCESRRIPLGRRTQKKVEAETVKKKKKKKMDKFTYDLRWRTGVTRARHENTEQKEKQKQKSSRRSKEGAQSRVHNRNRRRKVRLPLEYVCRSSRGRGMILCSRAEEIETEEGNPRKAPVCLDFDTVNKKRKEERKKGRNRVREYLL